MKETEPPNLVALVAVIATGRFKSVVRGSEHSDLGIHVPEMGNLEYLGFVLEGAVGTRTETAQPGVEFVAPIAGKAFIHGTEARGVHQTIRTPGAEIKIEPSLLARRQRIVQIPHRVGPHGHRQGEIRKGLHLHRGQV